MEILFFLAAIKADSLHTLAISAPANPGVCAAKFLMFTSLFNFKFLTCTLKISSLPFKSGLSIDI